tara:strand:- start:1096 stop:1776 length:681 start_codon:yes stop_codon:yes gene_type:complete
MNLMTAILMALYHREKTGTGQLVTTDLLSVAFHAHAWEGATELNADKIDAPAAVGGTEAAILKAFLTADGAIEISPVFSDNALRDISTAMGLGDLSLDPRFNTETLQIANGIELNSILAERFKEKSTAQWIEELEPRGVLCARVNTFAEARDDPQIKANNMVLEMNHERAGPLKMLGVPVRLHGTPMSLRHTPPNLGEHSREIAEELGYTAEKVSEMIESGALQSD